MDQFITGSLKLLWKLEYPVSLSVLGIAPQLRIGRRLSFPPRINCVHVVIKSHVLNHITDIPISARILLSKNEVVPA